MSHLVALCVQPLEDLFEAVRAGLAHPVEGVGSFHPAEVGGPVAARGVEDVRLAGHILHHEVLPLGAVRESLSSVCVGGGGGGGGWVEGFRPGSQSQILIKIPSLANARDRVV